MENSYALGNKRSGGKRRSQREEMWGPTREGCSFGGRPPLAPGDSNDIEPGHQPIPRWEKKFCTSVCSIPWKKLCETRKLMYMYPKIVEWDDSAGEEAFRNAKARYWAKINRLPCSILLPDPDMYIDAVDHNAVIDPELVEDLYKQPPPVQDEGEDGVVWDSFKFTTDTVPVTGWGDEEDDPTIYATDQSIQIQPTGWGDGEEAPTIHHIGQLIKIQPTGWGDEEDQFADTWMGYQSIQIQSTCWANPEQCDNEIVHEGVFPVNNSEADNRDDYSWQRQGCKNNGYNRKGQGGGQITGRYSGRKKANCANEQTVYYESQGGSVPCGLKGHGDSAGSWGTWQ